MGGRAMSAAVLDRERLVKLCGMFGSDHAGERANAAAAADRLIRAVGMRWLDVILPALPSPARDQDRIDTVADAIRFMLLHDEVLTSWESDFIRSVAAQGHRLSPKQIAIVERLFAKVRRAEARAA